MSNIYTTKVVPVIEEKKLVSFLDNYWKKNHSLVKSRTLLYFQHYNAEKQCFNFIVGENNKTKEYDALIGYIPTSQYDNTLSEKGDYWGAIWKIRDDIENEEINIVAFYLWKQLFKLPHFHSYAAIGISDIAKKIYKASRIPVATMCQYYIANNQIEEFHVAKNPLVHKEEGIGNNWKIVTMSSLPEMNIPEYAYTPMKSRMYFINRYEHHPIYKYVFWSIFDENEKIKNIWTIRRIVVDGISIYRIVDVLGKLEVLPDLSTQIQEKLQEEHCEYIDLMNFGISNDVFEKIGFNVVDCDSKDVIIPNYFEPFVKENIKIEIAYKSKYSNYVAFKADSDQDRPNIL